MDREERAELIGWSVLVLVIVTIVAVSAVFIGSEKIHPRSVKCWTRDGQVILDGHGYTRVGDGTTWVSVTAADGRRTMIDNATCIITED